jgi:hypothetical protein
LACKYQKWNVVKLLLLKGADPDVKDKVSAGQWWLYWPLSSTVYTLIIYSVYLYCIMIVMYDVCIYLADDVSILHNGDLVLHQIVIIIRWCMYI